LAKRCVLVSFQIDADCMGGSSLKYFSGRYFGEKDSVLVRRRVKL
jgi:hypothetical protein